MTTADLAWDRFDALVSAQRPGPWRDLGGRASFEPDFVLLEQLLAVPLVHGAGTQSGLPAKAVDVWIAAELRRAGFGDDEVWPRSVRPRVLPREVGLLLQSLPRPLAVQVAERLAAGRAGGVAPADASILGKAYYKQVDVVISQWARGPELLISTKRMDSSLSNNALNRIEESYGDAHNLRGRYPLAAIGYVLVVRDSALDKASSSAERLKDLLAKLGRDDGGYDATALLVAEWEEPAPSQDVKVGILDERVPADLKIGRFFEVMITAVLDRTPVDTHVRPREIRKGEPLAVAEDESRGG